MRLLFALLFISSFAYGQQTEKIDTLSLPQPEATKIEQLNSELKELLKTPEVQRYLNALSIRATIIESAFNHKGVPLPKRTEYNNGKVLYIKDEK